MRLFKTSYLNHLHDLSKACTIARREVLAEDQLPLIDDTDDDVWTRLGLDADLNEFGRVIAEAPSMLQGLLRALLRDGNALPRLRALYRIYRDGTRDTLNARLCRTVGINPDDADLAGELKAYLRD
jgi:hypothetical protein